MSEEISTERYSGSDKLAIALACLAGAMAIVLFLIEKTPATISVLLGLMVLLLIYPLLHFFNGKIGRFVMFVVVLLVAVALGWGVWPKKKPTLIAQPAATPFRDAPAQAPPLSSSTQTTPKPVKPKKEKDAPTHQSASGNNNNQIGGSITAGPCSNVQNGGAGNQATTNCVEPRDIITLSVQATFTAHLSSPDKVPDDYQSINLLDVEDETYFKGEQGRILLEPLETNRYHKTNVGELSTTLVYNLPTGSSLMGRPIDTLNSYNKLIIRPWFFDKDGQYFDKLLSSDISVLVNGKQIYRTEHIYNQDLAPGKTIIITAPFKIQN
jgi:hypothetical protein